MAHGTFLEEQLKRIRQMSERMSEIQNQIRDFRSPAAIYHQPGEPAHAEHRVPRPRRSGSRRRR
jgi:hypothetical protein